MLGVKSLLPRAGLAAAPESKNVLRVGVVAGALGNLKLIRVVGELFPEVVFENIAKDWLRQPLGDYAAVIVPVAWDCPDSISSAIERMARPSSTRIIVVFDGVDVATTHRLVRAGAVDVLTAPVTESALVVCLERLSGDVQNNPAQESGEIVAILKSGGGVGATTLACQCAAVIASRGGYRVCLADLDVQCGDAAVQLDLPRSASIADLLALGGNLEETQFQEVLGAHGSGLRLLAAPQDIMGLESISTQQIENLLSGLRRDFQLTLVDLPPAWTSWTTSVLNRADRIVLVTGLTVPHIQRAKRQLATLASLNLENASVLLACNQVGSEQQSSLSQKAAERALGRSIDIMIPEDRRVMTSASNQGLEVRQVKRGGKLDSALGVLADLIVDRSQGVIARRGAA
jgi:pilus assembly protein CpaE